MHTTTHKRDDLVAVHNIFPTGSLSLCCDVFIWPADPVMQGSLFSIPVMHNPIDDLYQKVGFPAVAPYLESEIATHVAKPARSEPDKKEHAILAVLRIYLFIFSSPGNQPERRNTVLKAIRGDKRERESAQQRLKGRQHRKYGCAHISCIREES